MAKNETDSAANAETPERAVDQAERILGDEAKIEKVLEAAEAKAVGVAPPAGRLRRFFYDTRTLIRLIRAYSNGTFRDISRKTIILSVAALIYFIMPADMLPDIFPLTGFIDDAAFVGFLMASIRGDLDRFRIWERSRGQ